MKQNIYEIAGCGIARQCRNDQCILRMCRVFNYPLEPSTKAEFDKVRDIEKKVGSKGYVPKFEQGWRDGKVQIVCPDYKDRP